MFIVHHSLFIFPCSLFPVHHSLFINHSSLFIVHWSLILVHFSSFIHRWSIIVAHCSSFIVCSSLVLVCNRLKFLNLDLPFFFFRIPNPLVIWFKSPLIPKPYSDLVISSKYNTLKKIVYIFLNFFISTKILFHYIILWKVKF